MPWDVITPDEVSRLSATELRAFKRNMEEFDYLLESYLKQGYPPKQAFRLAKQEMQGQVASSADVANIMMKQSVKAKKKKKRIPKILQKRNIKGKRKAQRAVGAGAALRGWGAVRRVS